jgi:protein dithiol oxidoreductase (disulfide-forming)
MNLYRRSLIGALALAPFASFAQKSAAYSELHPPLPVDAPKGKIEVAEFFWYGCIHCYNLEPYIETWLRQVPPDVAFRRVPAVFNNRLALDAAIFYAFESLGVLDKLHHPFFDAIHKGGLKTDNQQALAEWLQKNGLEPKKFFDTVKSFGVQSKVRRAAELTVKSKIDGTPAMAVHGRYTVSAGQGGSQQGMLQTVSQLVEVVRKQEK